MRVPPLSFLYMAIQQSGMLLPLSGLKYELSSVVHMHNASFMTNSIVQLARCSTLVSSQWIGWSSIQACSAMADLFREAFDASVLMLLQTCFKSTCSLTNTHISAGAWYFIDNICLLLLKEGGGGLTLVRREQRVGPYLNTTVMLKSLLIRSLIPAT